MTRFDPDELRRFARAVLYHTDAIQYEATTLKQSFDGLGSSWRDEKRREFQEELEETLRYLDGFYGDAERFVEHLHAKARLGDAYLGA